MMFGTNEKNHTSQPNVDDPDSNEVWKLIHNFTSEERLFCPKVEIYIYIYIYITHHIYK